MMMSVRSAGGGNVLAAILLAYLLGLFFFQAEDGIRDLTVTGFRRVLFRSELGESFFNASRFRDAVPELQRARQNPHARLKAMNLLGCCYGELGMLDLAMKQLEEASKEIVSMDTMQTDILYNLGIIYERMNETEKSLACMKQIYEVDYGYRDVAGRVESSYERDNSGP